MKDKKKLINTIELLIKDYKERRTWKEELLSVLTDPAEIERCVIEVCEILNIIADLDLIKFILEGE